MSPIRPRAAAFLLLLLLPPFALSIRSLPANPDGRIDDGASRIDGDESKSGGIYGGAWSNGKIEEGGGSSRPDRIGGGESRSVLITGGNTDDGASRPDRIGSGGAWRNGRMGDVATRPDRIFGGGASRSGTVEDGALRFTEAPEYRNGGACGSRAGGSVVHVAMTLDLEYLRGSIAAVQSVLRHASCPENVHFHFIAGEFDPASPRVLTRTVRSTFPSLGFTVHIFREDAVLSLISSAVREALENPLNYARNHLGDLLDPSIDRVIYLDSDLILVDDIEKLWSVNLTNSRVIGAPEYCHANFTKYFTTRFWSDPDLPRVFRRKTRPPCYFNTGVMVMDLRRWRQGDFRSRIERWMEIQKRKRIYELGSLPPFLLEFAGDVEPIDHRWNQHGLGGDNLRDSCRGLHPGPASLLHWSGKGKPWARLDAKKPCPIDLVWEPYDLYKRVDRSSW